MKRYKNPESEQPLSIRDFYERRNRVLLWHQKGGLGDVFMHRMLFEDFQRTMPDAEFVFACLPEYHHAAENHPYVTEVLDSRKVNQKEFTMIYNTCVTLADRYENRNAPLCDAHRSDIWANYCGVMLNKHEMHINIDPKIQARMRSRMEALSPGKPIVAFIPISKMVNKTLLDWQVKVLLDELKDCCVVGLHKEEMPGVPGIYDICIREWMACIAAADYVISVDTAAFHCAGGLKKPLVGIFTFADGKAYGKHFDFVLVQKHRDLKCNWDCGPCFKFGECPISRKTPKPCLTELSEKQIRDGIRAMFLRWPWDQHSFSCKDQQLHLKDHEENILPTPSRVIKDSVFSPGVGFVYRHDEQNFPAD